MMPGKEQTRNVWSGCHLSMMERGGWEFCTRNTRTAAVGIVAIRDDDRVVLVEQFRPPVGRRVIELPAGLSGDLPGAKDEPLLEAAQRELLEETGYTAQRWTELGCGYTSPGLTDESIVLYLAEGLRKQPSAGDPTEAITIHEVPIAELIPWLDARGAEFDLKLLAALYAAMNHRAQRPTGDV
jgi:ADP-ribose pyrophosphatase